MANIGKYVGIFLIILSVVAIIFGVFAAQTTHEKTKETLTDTDYTLRDLSMPMMIGGCVFFMIGMIVLWVSVRDTTHDYTQSKSSLRGQIGRQMLYGDIPKAMRLQNELNQLRQSQGLVSLEQMKY